MPPVGGDRPRPCPAITPVAQPATRGSTIPRPADRGGDHRGDAPDHRRSPRRPLAGPDRVLWRGGLRIQQAPALGERDLDPRRGSLLVRRGKSGRRREIGMDAWGWEQLAPWLAARVEVPVGPLFC